MLYCRDHLPALQTLLHPYHLQIVKVTGKNRIPGSFWGDSEAGLIQNHLYIRPDTPLHSALHEACHFICMDDQRRQDLHTDAGGNHDEENAVCYLQILLAGQMLKNGQEQLMQDMNEWGYSFRLGSCEAWFTQDAEDARDWLLQHDLTDENNHPAGIQRY